MDPVRAEELCSVRKCVKILGLTESSNLCKKMKSQG